MTSDISLQTKTSAPQEGFKIRYESRRAFLNAMLRNWSSSGLYVSMKRPYDAGRRFRLEISLPKNREWIKATCEVVWVNQTVPKDYPEWIYESQILKDIAPHQLHNGMRVKVLSMLPEYKKRIRERLLDVGGGMKTRRPKTFKDKTSCSKAKTPVVPLPDPMPAFGRS